MSKTEIAKCVVSVVVGSGTTKIVSAVIRNNVSPEKITDKVTIAAGSVVLGLMAADATKNYTDAKIDEAVAWWREHVTVTKN